MKPASEKRRCRSARLRGRRRTTGQKSTACHDAGDGSPGHLTALRREACALQKLPAAGCARAHKAVCHRQPALCGNVPGHMLCSSGQKKRQEALPFLSASDAIGSALFQKHPLPQPPPFPPQQHRSSRMIQMLSHPLPQPLFPLKKPPPFPPQQHRSNRIQIMLEQPPEDSHPHPQFVAAKSLIFEILHLF